MSIQLHLQSLGPVQTNAFLLIEEETKSAILIDTPPGVGEWLNQPLRAGQIKLTAILLTHGHYDHICGFHELEHTAIAGVPVYAHADDAIFFAQPASMSAFAPSGLKWDPIPVDHWVKEGDRITVPEFPAIEVRHVPGHAPGNILFYLPERLEAYVGDAIFAESIGRYDLPGGDFNVLEHSIQTRVYTLPDETILYPGHGPKTTVAHEKKHNPYVQPL